MAPAMRPRTLAAIRRAGLAAVSLAALLTVSGCGRSSEQAARAASGDVRAAVVDGQTIWASDVQREAAAQGVIGQGERLDPASELFRRMLDEVVDQRLLAAEALRRGVENDPDVRRRLEADRDRVLGDVLVQKIVEQAVNEGAVRGLYEEQRKLAKPADQFHARQIVVASQAEADAVRKLISSGAAFDVLASQRSTDAATRFNGGDLGYFTADTMPDAYAEALKTAKAGDIIGPLKTDAGWVLLKVEDRRAEPPLSLDAARPQIVRFLTYDQVRDLLQRLRGKAKVQLMAAQNAPTQNPPARKTP